MGCSTSCCPPAGAGEARTCRRGEALRRLERLAPALVLADTVAENTASVRILERLGFVRTAVHHRAFCREGRMLDIWDYARPLELVQGDRLTGTAPCNMKK